MAANVRVLDIPWYLIDQDSRTIRVYHGDLDDSRWERGMSLGETHVRRIEDVIRVATGLRRVSRIHDQQIVELRIRPELFARAAIAVRMSFKCLAENDEVLRRILARRAPAN